jgi:hypothetical protein
MMVVLCDRNIGWLNEKINLIKLFTLSLILTYYFKISFPLP